ncbi:PPE domain-containing protein [Mycobacterium palustre]|uniref:PPE domain-containing protein n=1 Tax=Mycobacterium palustre TaxID=153971 RepID=UPI000A1677EE|nr:ribonuclease domain-containing protein [Mycobacterium palustre]MCV7102700.1 PPE domain-containing protein [Mycobacterium palustre]
MAHPWPSFSPEANYTSLMSGSGPASTLAYAETLSAHAANLQTVAATSTATGSATYGTSWQGASAGASATTQTALDTQHELLVVALTEKVPHVAAAAAAHQTALASMVTAEQAVANRMEEHAAEQINLITLGAMTPRIAALNFEYYGHMWPRNAAAGAAYGAALRASTAAIMVPFPPAVPGGSAVAPAVAAAALAENAAVSAAGATMQASEQAVQAAITPAAAAQPSARTVTGAPQAPTGMFARPPQAETVAAPTTGAPPGPGLTPSLVDQALMSRAETLRPPTGSAPGPGGVASGYPGAGFTSYLRPTGDGFTPPTDEQLSSARPGMLNAVELRCPVTAAPLTAAQPLAYVPPEPSRPTVASTPSQRPQLDFGGPAHKLNPPPPPQLPPASRPPAAPQSGPPGPPPDGNGPSGLGAQMLGSGPGQAPQAPPFPIPLDPRPPVPPPPPPSPGEPPLQPPSPPAWASPPIPKSVEAAQKAYQDLISAIEHHNSWRPDPTNLEAVNAYNQEAWTYNAWKDQLERQLNSSNAQYTPAKDAVRTDIPSWTQPAPEQPHQPGPQVPQKVQEVLKQIDEGKWPQAANAPGTKGGRPYENEDQLLPTTDSSGKPITYQEWDVNPRVPGQVRDDERIVTGSDGSAWYTSDHYGTFRRLR